MKILRKRCEKRSDTEVDNTSFAKLQLRNKILCTDANLQFHQTSI